MNRKSFFLLVGLAFCFLTSSAAAAEAKAGNAEMQKLSIFTGKWKLDEIDYESPFGPAGKAVYNAETKLIYNGHFLEEKGEGKVGDLEVKYTIITHYDAASRGYKSLYYDSNGALSPADVTVEGRTMRGRGTAEINGKKYQMKSVSTLSEDGKKSEYEWSYSEDGTNWKTMFKGTGTKR
jgi:hypothetical protein